MTAYESRMGKGAKGQRAKEQKGKRAEGQKAGQLYGSAVRFLLEAPPGHQEDQDHYKYTYFEASRLYFKASRSQIQVQGSTNVL